MTTCDAGAAQGAEHGNQRHGHAVPVHNLDPSNRPLLAEIAKMAKARNIIIHVHSGAAPVRLFFELEPELTIIWDVSA